MLLENSFYNLKPMDCLELTFKQSIDLLIEYIGESNFELAKNFQIKSPLHKEENTNWIKKTKIVAINPRITKTYWGIVKYALSFPEKGIHLMPLFETGDGSLYVQNSWRLNSEFYDKNLEEIGFNTCEKQLKFVINILHAMGKYVGFDALPHVDNFSEITILNPELFEWVKLNKEKTAEDVYSNRNENYKEIQDLLIREYSLPENFFDMPEQIRYEKLFPVKGSSFERRMQIRKTIRDNGFEPVPVIEHSPMRPILFDKIHYSENENWATFYIPEKNSYAKIMGSLTPYSWYSLDDKGFVSKNSVRKQVWEYFVNKINEFQKEYGFDFLRADMAHNQIAHSHSGEKELYVNEVWADVKNKIHKEKPFFATFGEAFFSDYYISAVNDMTNKKFDVVLGNLNFQYLDNAYTDQINKIFHEQGVYKYAHCNTVFTNDSDLPDHQELYQSQEANILRFFMALFMNNVSYMGMGFEIRDLFPDSEYNYSNYYVKKQEKDYEFGKNYELFDNISKMRKLYSRYSDIIENNNMCVHKTNSDKIFCWSYNALNKNLLFMANFDPNISEVMLDGLEFSKLDLKYANSYDYEASIVKEDNGIKISNFYIGECAVYEYEK